MILPEWKPVVVLGAGPGGLSIGHELARHGIDYVIIEKGKAAGESFTHYPRHIFFGPWLNNTLPGSNVGWTWKLRRATQPAYTWYLGEYARRNRLPIQFETTVHNVEKTPHGFTISTSQGRIECALIVNATGYFSTPNLPNIPGLDQSNIVWMHSQQYRDVNDLRRRLGGDSGRVLVVGSGLSAGETMVELFQQGYQVCLSHRGTLKIGLSPFKEALLSPINATVEKLAISLDIRLNSNPPMAGGETERLIKEGLVKTFPSIQQINGNDVHFSDGRIEHFDAMVFCTGYRYTRDHLREILGDEPIEVYKMESTHVPGLFFLGLDQQRTYRSRFLRGLRADAKLLAPMVAERVRQVVPKRAPEVQVLPLDQETFIDLTNVPNEVRT
jgi:putative flavoprotein involved in K+ transport